MAKMRSMMSKLKLTVNETKTRTCVLPDETFDFLGYTFGRCYNHRTGAAYLAASPAKKKIAKLCDAIGEQTSSRRTQRDEEEMVGRLNRKLRGWVNYFDLGTVGRAYSSALRYRRSVGEILGIVVRPELITKSEIGCDGNCRKAYL
jgi:RNA-directed DNA polymerase